MNNATRQRYLQFALRAIGLVFIFGVYPLTVVWPSGWSWHVGQSHYLIMIIGIYATLGAFLFLAAKGPARHISLISFAIWSSVVHGAIMAVQAFSAPEHMGHLYGDVLALFVVAAALAFLCPTAARLSFDGRGA